MYIYININSSCLLSLADSCYASTKCSWNLMNVLLRSALPLTVTLRLYHIKFITTEEDYNENIILVMYIFLHIFIYLSNLCGDKNSVDCHRHEMQGERTKKKSQ